MYCPVALPILPRLHATVLPAPHLLVAGATRRTVAPRLRTRFLLGFILCALLGGVSGCLGEDRPRPVERPRGELDPRRESGGPGNADWNAEPGTTADSASASPGLPPGPQTLEGHRIAGAVPGSRSAGRVLRGVWVLAEGSVRVWDDPARIPEILDRATQLGVTDLFVQVYRGGRAFYAGPAGVERAPAVNASPVDALRTFLDAAHRRGLRVHAWVNVLSLSKRPEAWLIEQLGREAILVDRVGRSLLDYPDFDLPQPDRRYYRMGTPGIYLDPALPAVREHLVATFRDLVSRYPELDGLHLDYIRHPGVLPFSPGSRFGVGLEFGYGTASRALYRAETGNADPIEGAAPGMVRHANEWDEWRREQVTRLVEEIAATCRAARPGLVVSAAVIPFVDRAYLSLAQDWRRWLESGALDLAMPMVYTLDDRLLRYQLESFAGWKQADRIWPGIGIWLFSDSPERAKAQVEAVRRLGFAGEMLFSDDGMASAPGLVETLRQPSASAESGSRLP